MHVECMCGEGFELHYKTVRKTLLSGFENFCSSNCLRDWFYHTLTVTIPHNILAVKRILPANLGQPHDYWCPTTKQWYRSKSESIFAIWLRRHGLAKEYESYTIKLDKNSTYTPDFWVPRAQTFFEVKGIWRGSGKRKTRKAVALGFDVVLIPDHLIHKLEKSLNVRAE